MAKSPRTHMAGSSSPEDAREQRQQLAVTLGVLFVAFPLGTLVAAMTYQVGMVMRRYRWQQIALWAGAWVLLWLVLHGQDPLHSYTLGYREALAGLRDRTLGATAAANWLTWVLAQVPLGFVGGTALGAAYSAFRWWRRPEWMPDDRRESPLARRRRSKVIEQISHDVDGPSAAQGTTLGYEHTSGRRVLQSPSEAAAHTFVVGKSGTGKTTGLMLGARDIIRQGSGLVVIDLKGSADVPPQIAKWAARHGRVFHHWKMQPIGVPYDGPASGLSFYEPVGRGEATRRAGMLLATRKWSVEADHYKATTEAFLQAVFNLIEIAPHEDGIDAISDVVALSTNAEALMGRAQQVFDAQQIAVATDTTGGWQAQDVADMRLGWLQNYTRVVDERIRTVLNAVASFVNVGRDGKVTIDDIIRAFGRSLSTFKQSVAGPYLDQDPAGLRDIDLARVFREGQVVVFSLDSSNYEELSASVGAMIVQDLKTVSSELREDPDWMASSDPRQRGVVLLDEFAALGADNIGGLLSKARDSKIAVTLSTQSLGQLEEHSTAFKDAVLNTVSSFVVYCCNTQGEAETLAGLTGSELKQVRMIGVERTTGLTGMDTGAATGNETLREEWRPVVEPNEFQNLPRGECIYVSAAAGQRRTVRVTTVKDEFVDDSAAPGLQIQWVDPDTLPSEPLAVAALGRPTLPGAPAAAPVAAPVAPTAVEVPEVSTAFAPPPRAAGPTLRDLAPQRRVPVGPSHPVTPATPAPVVAAPAAPVAAPAAVRPAGLPTRPASGLPTRPTSSPVAPVAPVAPVGPGAPTERPAPSTTPSTVAEPVEPTQPSTLAAPIPQIGEDAW